MVKQALQGGGRAIKRHCQFLAHYGHRHVDSGDASQYARQQIAAFEGCRVPAIRHLVVGGAVDIIENRTWEPASGQSAKVMKIVAIVHTRSEERRVGKECVSKCRSRWSPYH